MNTTSTRRTAATLATATAFAAALTITSAIASPTAASAHRPDPLSGPATHCGGTVASFDIALEVAHRKACAAQYYVDHALELYQRAAQPVPVRGTITPSG